MSAAEDLLSRPLARRRVPRVPRLPLALLAGLAVLSFALVLALAPGHVAPYSPTAFDYRAILKEPSALHPFGTDNFGRDVLSRTIWAYRVDLQIALFGTLFPVVVGTLLGAVVGYRGGWAEAVFGRVVDMVVTFPFLVLVIAIVAVLGPGLSNLYIAVSAVGWVFYARIVAAGVAVQRRLDYAAAARVLGYGTARIVLRHLLPNASSAALVYWMTDMALVILLGSSLGYLGLGAQPPAAEWGVLIADGKNYMGTAWWISIFPGLAIVSTGLGFSLLGDGLADLPAAAALMVRLADARGPGAEALAVRDLRVLFPSPAGPAAAVDGVDLDVAPGETLGLVGESGSGKSLTLRAILRLVHPPGRVEGRALWDGRDLLGLPEREMRRLRGREIAAVFQEPMTALNPVLTVGRQIDESLRAHTGLDARNRRTRAAELLDLVGIQAPASRLADYPHQFSGGMRQRAMIAIALAGEPRLLLADEPTTALDVTIQDEILRLMGGLRARLGMGVVFVTHDLGVVAGHCDRVAVMYAGRIVEAGPVGDVFARPRHAYTRGLVGSVPRAGAERRPLLSIDGTPPGLGDRPPGCSFAPRCPFATDLCRGAAPALVDVLPGRRAACWHHEAVAAAGLDAA